MRIVKGLFIFVLVAIFALGLAGLLLRSKERTSKGHTMAQWLTILRSNTNSTDNPLRIVQIINDDKFGNLEFEVPLSYDLLLKYDFLERNGSSHLIVNK